MGFTIEIGQEGKCEAASGFPKHTMQIIHPYLSLEARPERAELRFYALSALVVLFRART